MNKIKQHGKTNRNKGIRTGVVASVPFIAVAGVPIIAVAGVLTGNSLSIKTI